MKTYTFLTTILSFVLTINAISAERLFLQFSCEFSDIKGGPAMENNRIQGSVALGEEFYFRSVTENTETIFKGKTIAQKEDPKSIEVEYFYRRAELNGSAEPAIVVSGKHAIQLSKETKIANNSVKNNSLKSSAVNYYLKAEPFFPGVGSIYQKPTWSVKLVDENGKPVANAKTAMYDEDGVQAIGVAASNQQGIVQRSNRESLPLYTFVAEHKERGLFAMANLDRDKADQVFTVTMRKNLKKPDHIDDLE